MALWDLVEGRRVRFWTEMSNETALSPGGDWLASSNGTSIHVCDTGSEASVIKLESAGGSMRALAFSPDGRLVAGGDSRGAVHIWQLADRVKLATLQAQSSEIESVTFTKDCQSVVTTSRNETVRCAISSNQSCLRWPLTSPVVVSPYGTIVADSSSSASWDLERGVRVARLGSEVATDGRQLH